MLHRCFLSSLLELNSGFPPALAKQRMAAVMGRPGQGLPGFLAPCAGVMEEDSREAGHLSVPLVVGSPLNMNNPTRCSLFSIEAAAICCSCCCMEPAQHIL